MRLRIPSLFVALFATTSCGIIAYSTDDLSGGGGGGVLPPGSNPDGGTVLVDGAVVPLDGAPLGEGGAFDTGTPPGIDAAPDAKTSCPANPCPGTDVCCYVKEGADDGAWRCQATCAGGATECVGPQQCTTDTPLCCGTARFGAGTLPNCPIDALASSCAASCTTNFALSCNVTNTMRLCHEKADCASDPQNKNCCTYSGSGVSAIVCVSDLIRDFGGLLCLP